MDRPWRHELVVTHHFLSVTVPCHHELSILAHPGPSAMISCLGFTDYGLNLRKTWARLILPPLISGYFVPAMRSLTNKPYLFKWSNHNAVLLFIILTLSPFFNRVFSTFYRIKFEHHIICTKSFKYVVVNTFLYHSLSWIPALPLNNSLVIRVICYTCY